MKIKYGLAQLDRYTGVMSCNINLPMEGVGEGGIYEFLQSAGDNGWELCGAFPCGVEGMKRHIPGQAETRKCEDAAEEIAFIFKQI